MEEKNITISMEEYKELLIIKGKYEEVKSQQITRPILYNEPTLTRSYQELPKEPYKVT